MVGARTLLASRDITRLTRVVTDNGAVHRARASHQAVAPIALHRRGRSPLGATARSSAINAS
jgi:hypothetical protein